jgi:hypothetical protein
MDDSEVQSSLFTARLAYYSFLKTKAVCSSGTSTRLHGLTSQKMMMNTLTNRRSLLKMQITISTGRCSAADLSSWYTVCVCVCVCVCILYIYIWLCSPLLDLDRYFSFLIFYTVSRTPWTGDQPVARSLPAHRTAHKHRHPCLEWDSNPRSQCSSGRRRRGHCDALAT